MLLLTDLREKPVALLEDTRPSICVKEGPPLFLNENSVFVRLWSPKRHYEVHFEYDTDLGPVCR